MADKKDALFSAALEFGANRATWNRLVKDKMSKCVTLALDYLEDDELPEGGIAANHGGCMCGFLWVTNKRLLYAGIIEGLFSKGPVMLDHWYDKISSIEVSSPDHPRYPWITVNAGGNRTHYVTFRQLARVEDFVALVRKKASNQQAAQPSDVAAQLECLSKLKEQGMISEDEFKAAKAKLLGL